jgi:hypothetical protein
VSTSSPASISWKVQRLVRRPVDLQGSQAVLLEEVDLAEVGIAGRAQRSALLWQRELVAGAVDQATIEEEFDRAA